MVSYRKRRSGSVGLRPRYILLFNGCIRNVDGRRFAMLEAGMVRAKTPLF